MKQYAKPISIIHVYIAGWFCTLYRVTKDNIMELFIIVILVIVIFVCAFGYMINRDASRRTKEKKRNRYNDRV